MDDVRRLAERERERERDSHRLPESFFLRLFELFEYPYLRKYLRASESA
jgi:hypothetical protein